jgi:ppGpp synthetase/RelA/SpoT-type nucleotidyltranferase
MNGRIVAILDEQKYRLVEGPIANIWDNETQVYFKRLGFKTRLRETLYTSVHYVIELNTASRVRCELQVRTLADEVWGEVSHTVDYPKPTKSIACKEQLKVLARVTSGCTRLVDSIFRSRQEFEKQRAGARRLRKAAGTSLRT